MLFETRYTHLAVTAWVKERLLSALRLQSLIVMDNAPFHNRSKITALLKDHGHYLLPLPR